MTEINLLPWRELKREQEKKQFTSYLFLGLTGAILIVFSINYYATSLVDGQLHRNQRLEQEISLLDKQIAEIKNLKQLKAALVSRMTIIQNLQATRSLLAHLMDELVKIIPESIFLTHMERKNDTVTLQGYAESNSDISFLMRRIEESIWLHKPTLTEIKKTAEKQEEKNEFTLSFILKPKLTVGKTP